MSIGLGWFGQTWTFDQIQVQFDLCTSDGCMIYLGPGEIQPSEWRGSLCNSPNIIQTSPSPLTTSMASYLTWTRSFRFLKMWDLSKIEKSDKCLEWREGRWFLTSVTKEKDLYVVTVFIQLSKYRERFLRVKYLHFSCGRTTKPNPMILQEFLTISSRSWLSSSLLQTYLLCSMGFHVFLQMPSLWKALWTLFTSKWFLSRMSSQMSLQMSSLKTGIRTLFESKWFLFRMGSHVSLLISRLRTRKRTLFTTKRFPSRMSSHMRLQASSYRTRIRTFFASKWFISRMSSQMFLQTISYRTRIRTLFTWKCFLSRMGSHMLHKSSRFRTRIRTLFTSKWFLSRMSSYKYVS